jgi:putative nucleotidyltransferase with HDIG domain
MDTSSWRKEAQMLEDVNITMNQLRVGLYIELDLKWFEHPFAFSHFKIKNEEQISTLRSLGLQTVRYNPGLSDTPPLPPEQADREAPVDAAPAPDVSPALAAKRAIMARLKQHRAEAARIEGAFAATARTIRDIEKQLFNKPEESTRQAHALISQISDSILCAPELAIHVMGDTLGNEELYFHSLNVTMLSMMIAREVQLPAELAGVLGLGALFHDIGRKNIPGKILTKIDAYTQSEQHLYEMHAQYGYDMAQKLQLAVAVCAIVRDHHELYDGSGYPRHLKGDAIGVLARIVAIANYYDELCNPVSIAQALTPHEALSMMFAKHRARFDPKLLQVFIRCMGVYPPGTIVQLSNNMTGMVATVNTAKPMRPILVIYDASVPRHEAIMVDMEQEPDLQIVKAIRPGQVAPEMYAYLSPRKRVSYYFDAQPGTAEPG